MDANDLKKMFEDQVKEDKTGTAAEVHHLSQIMTCEELTTESLKYITALLERSSIEITHIEDKYKDNGNPALALMMLSHLKTIKDLQDCVKKIEKAGAIICVMICSGEDLIKDFEKEVMDGLDNMD